MSQHLLITLLSLLFTLMSCGKRMITYPYAENNTSVTKYYGTEIKDDYQWMEIHPAENPKLQEWLNAQSQITSEYFEERSPSVSNRLQELSLFPRLSFIKSSTDTLYYAAVHPYSPKIDIYKYNNEANELLKQIESPTVFAGSFNALMLQDGRHLALIAESPDLKKNLYIYDLRDSSDAPVHIIPHVIDRPLIPRDHESFFLLRDALAEEGLVLGANSVYICNYRNSNGALTLDINEYYTDTKGCAGNAFEVAYDEKSKEIYLGRFALDNPSQFQVLRLSQSASKSHDYLFSVTVPDGQEYRLAGADEFNIYLINFDPDITGSLLVFNKSTHKLDTVISNPDMRLYGFSLIKDRAVISFQSKEGNKLYLINNKTLAIQEVGVPDNKRFNYYYNKLSNDIYYSRESPVSAREICKVDQRYPDKWRVISDLSDAPFSPDDYQIENVSVKTETDREVNIQLLYKKGMIRDGNNPVVVLTYTNAQDAYLDRFNFSRILYMDKGFIYVQRANIDSKKDVELDERTEDVFAIYNYLIDEKYSSPRKIGFIGREMGASVLLSALNKYQIQAPAVLIDGIYDHVYYNRYGKLRYFNHKIFQANDSLSFRSVYERSPYHAIVPKKSYPPMLLISSGTNRLIPAHHTYKLAARLQMRTQVSNPVILLTPEIGNCRCKQEAFSYKEVIEHGLLFLAPYLDVGLN